MHECLLCKRDMKVANDTFGNGCIRNIYSFLDIQIPKKVKLREDTLYKNVMKKTNKNMVNKKQRVWLTDRYLTYNYLDKLKYGNYDDIKEKINNEIENIDRIKRIEEIKTAQEIQLKEAYDLYRKEKKFETNFEKIKNKKYKDNNELKVLIAGISFIFNMYRNKNQYEKNSFKAMQYAFWQLVIEGGREFADFHISAKFLQHSLEEKPEDLLFIDGKEVEDIINDKHFQDNINKIVQIYGENSSEFLFDSNNDDRFPMNFNEKDLYFSIHSADLIVIGEKREEKWNLQIKLHDRYDYTKPKNIVKYYTDTKNVVKSVFSSTLYNLAYLSMKFGVMKEYNIDVQIELNGFEVH